MSASKTAILAAVLLASSLLTTSPTQALPCGSNFPPSTVQEVRDCVPPPPPPPSKCDLTPDYLEAELRASGKIDEDCNLNPPTCQNTIPPSGPVSCNPDPEKTCQEVFADSVNDPDPCNPPSCETVAGNTGAAKPEACTPPTCLEAGTDAGMDDQVVEAACDTIEPPICEEIGQYFTAIGNNDTLPGRDEDCLPTLCVDLEEPTACLPGCNNIRDIIGGVGHLLLDADCLPRKPLCEEVAPYTPIQPDFWIDCVPWGLPPTCEEAVETVNDLGEDYLPQRLSCDIPGLPVMLCWNAARQTVPFLLTEQTVGQYYTVWILKEVGGSTVRAGWNSQLPTSIEGVNTYITWDVETATAENKEFDQGISGPCGEIVTSNPYPWLRVRIDFGGLDYEVETSETTTTSVTVDVRLGSAFELSLANLAGATRSFEFGVSGTWEYSSTTTITVHGVKKVYVSDPISNTI